MKKLMLICAVAITVTAMLINGCKKPNVAPVPQSPQLKTNSVNNSVNNDDGIGMAKSSSHCNNEHRTLIHLIKQTKPPLSDKELIGKLIDASPICDAIIKELLKRGQPPANAPIHKETLQLLLLYNLPLSDHIQKEILKHYSAVLNRSLIDNINLNNLPDMKLEKANLLMESLLNLKFGEGEKEFQAIKRKTTTFQVEGKLLSNKYFTLALKFLDIMNQMKQRCVIDKGEVAAENPSAICHIMAADLEIITSINPKTGDKIFDVTMTTIVAIQFPIFSPKCNFDNTDTWFAGLEYGRCAPNSGGVGDDAATIIGKLINAQRGQGSNICGSVPVCKGAFFYSNIVDLFRNPQSHPAEYYQGLSNDCLITSQMNTRLGLAMSVIDADEITLGKRFVAIDMFADIIPGGPPPTPIGHSAFITYGSANCGPLPE